jgi:hypothetical protein
MLAMAAVASGAIWLRLVLAAANHFQLPFDAVYAVAAWACWLAPLALTAAALLAWPTPNGLAASQSPLACSCSFGTYDYQPQAPCDPTHLAKFIVGIATGEAGIVRRR